MKRLFFTSLFILSCVTTFSQTGFRLFDKMGIHLGMSEDSVRWYAVTVGYGEDAYTDTGKGSMYTKREAHREFGSKWALGLHFKDKKLNIVSMHKSSDSQYFYNWKRIINDRLTQNGWEVTENISDRYDRQITEMGYIPQYRPSYQKQITYISPTKDIMVMFQYDELDGSIFVYITYPPEYILDKTTQNQLK